MICALTVRKLKPGSVEDFMRAFAPEDVEVPEGLQRFYALRKVDDDNELITFSLYDGTVEELRTHQSEGSGYERRRHEIDQYVESVGADGFYEVIEERSFD